MRIGEDTRSGESLLSTDPGAPQRVVARAPAATEADVDAARLQLAALQVRECAKPWLEADADVCEAIDFLEYYARGPSRWPRGANCCRSRGSATR